MAKNNILKASLIPVETKVMHAESERLKSFKDWPFNDDCLCTAKMMAEAGFYHIPSDNEPDLVTCFVCYKELDGWEPADDPWVEHKNHSNKCPFISMGKKQADWTFEDSINIEIKRQEFAIKKSMEAMGDQMLDLAQTVRDQMESL